MRRPRLEYEGAMFHVFARGNEKKPVFLQDGDRVKYLRLMGEELEKRGVALYAYCLMPNHVHLLAGQESEQPLSRYMQRLQGAYALFINHKYGRVGHLFQGRYKSILIDGDAYMLELVRYIHLNPLRAGLKNADRYPWTSHLQYVGVDKQPLAKVRAEKVLARFSDKRKVAVRKYLRFLQDGGDGRIPEGAFRPRDKRIMGDEAFERRAKTRAGYMKTGNREKVRLTVPQLWSDLLKRNGIIGEPAAHMRSRLIGEMAYRAMVSNTLKKSEIARHFDVDPSTVTKAMRNYESRINEEEDGIGKFSTIRS